MGEELIHQAYRYELDPNLHQLLAFRRFSGAQRYCYNWGLRLCINHLEGGMQIPSAYDLSKIWNGWKRTGAPWYSSVSTRVPLFGFLAVQAAFKAFWEGKKAGRSVGFPRFHKRGSGNSFALNGSIQVLPRAVKLPRIGMVRTKESTGKFKGRALRATVSREADRWFVSLSVERKPKVLQARGPVVGIDRGLKHFAVCSDGRIEDAPNALRRAEKRLKHIQRGVSRKQKGSSNRRKAVFDLARAHLHVKNERRDFLHKLTTDIAKNYSVIVIEDLAVKNMVKNHHLAKSIVDAGWGEFSRMLAYKTKWYGSELVVAPRFYASSKRCSSCGNIKKELSLSERTYHCDVCGLEIDRDLNAAVNLKLVAGSAPETLNACGGDVRLDPEQTPSKQEDPRARAL